MPPAVTGWSRKREGDGVKIHYVSDIHVEFGALDKPLPEGDVLLLAGDTTVIAPRQASQ